MFVVNSALNGLEALYHKGSETLFGTSPRRSAPVDTFLASETVAVSKALHTSREHLSELEPKAKRLRFWRSCALISAAPAALMMLTAFGAITQPVLLPLGIVLLGASSGALAWCLAWAQNVGRELTPIDAQIDRLHHEIELLEYLTGDRTRRTATLETERLQSEIEALQATLAQTQPRAPTPVQALKQPRAQFATRPVAAMQRRYSEPRDFVMAEGPRAGKMPCSYPMETFKVW